MKTSPLFRYEAFVAIVLSFIGGLLDVYCLFQFNLYCMLHTGNLIKLETYLLDGDYPMFLATLLIILAFAAGIYLANLYEHHRKHTGNKGLLRISILILFAAAVIPNDSEPGVLSSLKMLSAVLFGLEGAFLLHSFIRFGDYSYSATTMTANINRLVTGIYSRITTKDKIYNYSIRVYLLIFAFFILGVGTGYAYLRFLPRFHTGFMRFYGYNLLLLLPITVMMILFILSDTKYKE